MSERFATLLTSMPSSPFIPYKKLSPNFTPRRISVEFLILHYTAEDLERSLDILTDPAREVSAHFVISEQGEVFELVPCWEGEAYRAWHAGRSVWRDREQEWKEFNDFSIGIELVNVNGNLFAYPDAQYKALQKVVVHLKDLYPALKDPWRILGHEQIAGWRGKADPGVRFDWGRFFKDCYTEQPVPERLPCCPSGLQTALEKLIECQPETAEKMKSFWHALSYLTETAVRLYHTEPDK